MILYSWELLYDTSWELLYDSVTNFSHHLFGSFLRAKCNRKTLSWKNFHYSVKSTLNHKLAYQFW